MNHNPRKLLLHLSSALLPVGTGAKRKFLGTLIYFRGIMVMHKIQSSIKPLSVNKTLFLVLLLLGIFFRFVNLDQKIYWRDEALTSLQISGYTQKEFIQQTFNSQIISPEYLQKYVHISPEKSLTDTINALATETPEHPPLYYIMLRFWVQHFGDSVAVIRSLSAFISLLVFPCIYWLCLELFESPTVGWIAVGLIAVSPFHVEYAQQAREYSFWTVTTLLSSAVLLQAMRLKTRVSWAVYAAMLVIGLYSHSFFVFVLIGHIAYILITANFRFTKTVKAFIIASLIGIVSFIPWIWTTIYHLPEVHRSMDWTNQKATLLDLIKMWFSNVRFILFDIEIPKIPHFSLFYLLVLCITVLVGYSIYFLCRHTQKQVWLFVLILILSSSLPLILPDVILGGTRSTTARYWIPCYLGIHLSIAYLFATQMSSVQILKQKKLLKIIMAIVISGEVVACAIGFNARVFISNPSQNEGLTRLINQKNHPLVVSNSYRYNPTELLSLSYLLDSKVRLQLVNELDFPNPNISNEFSDVFFLNPLDDIPPKWQSELSKKQYKLEPVKELKNLWKLKK